MDSNKDTTITTTTPDRWSPEVRAKISAGLKASYAKKRELGIQYKDRPSLFQPGHISLHKRKSKLKNYTVDDWKRHIYERVLIHPQTQCWIWQLALLKPSIANPSGGGYGMMQFYVDGKAKMRTVHRVAYELWVGPIPASREICHHDRLCTSKACCNPDHLYAGTSQQNLHDAYASGFDPASVTRGKKAFTDGNTSQFCLPGQEPKGWRPGMTGDQGRRGSKWYTDGVKSIRVYPSETIPDGYQPGLAKKTRKNINGQVQH